MKTVQKFQSEGEFSLENFFIQLSTGQHIKTLSRHVLICHANAKIMESNTMILEDVRMTIKTIQKTVYAKLRTKKKHIQEWGRKFPGKKYRLKK